MTRSFSPLTARIAGRGSDAWTLHFDAVAAAARGEDVVVLSVGDPEFDTPRSIAQAAVAALESGDTHYADIPGRPPLRRAVARRHAERIGRPVAPEEVIICAGAQNALYIAAACLLGPGDHVLVLEPAYVTYPATLGASGAEVTYVPMTPESGFRLDAAALEAAVPPRTRAILFCNPNNPTGVVMRPDEIEALLAFARRHDLWVVTDEVYAELVFEGDFTPAAALDRDERVVTIGSLSKSHAMTGWRCGWIAGPKSLVAHADRLSMAMFYGLPGFIQEGALAALEEGPAVPAAMRETYRRRRDLVARILEGTPGLAFHVPQSGMFMMLDVSGTGLTGGAFAHSLFSAQRVSVLDGATFGAVARDFVRVSFAPGEAMLIEGTQRIRAHATALVEGAAPLALAG